MKYLKDILCLFCIGYFAAGALLEVDPPQIMFEVTAMVFFIAMLALKPERDVTCTWGR